PETGADEPARRALRRRGARTPLPSLFLSNLRSLSNKTEELLLLNQTNKDFSAASALCFTETWLSELTPDSALHLPGFQLHRADRDAERSGKSRGGGICFYINERWCRDTTVLLKSCSPHLESLFITCRPFYSPREFSSFILAGTYIAPSACTSDALKQLAEQITKVEREFPDSLLIILGDFNSANLTKQIPKYRQHIACPTREGNTLDKRYTCIKNAYRAVTRAAVGLSDHSLVHLIPTYRQKLKTNKPVITTVKRWTSGDTEKLQGCFKSTNWAVFEEALDGLDEYTDTVTSYISFCEDSCISTKSQVRYSNNKPWFTAELKQLRREKEEAFRSGDRTVFKEAKYRLEKGIRAAKSKYSEQLNRHITANDPSSAWKGLQLLTAHKNAPPTLYPVGLETIQQALQAHGQLLGSHERHLQQLTHSISEVTQSIQPNMNTTSTATAAPVATVPFTESPYCPVRIATPDKYDGSPGFCKGFMLQCSLVFSRIPAAFPTDNSKIAFVLSLLTGKALQWAIAVWGAQGENSQTFLSFQQSFEEVFDHSASGEDPGEQLLQLRQGSASAVDHSLAFRTLAAESGWGEKALKGIYRQSLNESLKSELACRDEPLSLSQLIQLSIKLDNMIRSR
ncbi:hypothetical protein NFI96_030156, partial [Prochilodus magdalenae]